MLVMLALWFLFSIAVQVFVTPLNLWTIPFLDLSLGFFMTAHGAVIAFVIMAFWFVRRQDRIDRDHFLDQS
jgi:putative solute:sodium symporter small subunit